MTFLELYTKINDAGVPIWHYEAAQENYPYAVYQEYAVTYDNASGRQYREKTRVSIAHFSKDEFDPTLETLKKVLLENSLIPTISITYDKDSKIIVNQFEITIARHMEG